MSTQTFTSQVFAPIDGDLTLERFAGGNETEVFRTDDLRQVVKLKSETATDVSSALAYAQALRAAASEFIGCLGPEYSIRSSYLLARDEQGQVQVLVVQPFIANARPLSEVNFSSLSPPERIHIARQLFDIVRRSKEYYRRTGRMPDLYGRSASSRAERARLRRPHMLPKRIWSFLVKRNLLRSFNLLLTDAPEHRVILVDYDPLRRSKLYRRVYYTVRQLLFLRDYLVVAKLRHGRFRLRAGARRP